MQCTDRPQQPILSSLTDDVHADRAQIAAHGTDRAAQIEAFREIIYRRFREYPRPMLWRETDDPYRILVSEIMLQQTQVERVREKYPAFIGAFPDFRSLAEAPLRMVVRAWQGLGYNRRAKMLKAIAERVIAEFDGQLPSSPEILVTLPGIGPATAASIAAFAFGIPTPFIETNIRRVFLHFFFPNRENVRDREILPLVEETLDLGNPRTWYYALMDYGVMLKKHYPNANRRSAHYTRQAPFEGSERQIRGMILRLLADRKGLTETEIVREVGRDAERVRKSLTQLTHEGLLWKDGARYGIP